jgi:hypothetical protein
MIDGTYMCDICLRDAEAVERRRRARSRNRLLLIGLLGTLGLVAWGVGSLAYDRQPATGSALAYAFVPFAAVTLGLVRTRGARRERLESLHPVERWVYWAVALPALVFLGAFILAFAILGIWGEREGQIDRDAEAVRRGVRRGLRDL